MSASDSSSSPEPSEAKEPKFLVESVEPTSSGDKFTIISYRNIKKTILPPTASNTNADSITDLTSAITTTTVAAATNISATLSEHQQQQQQQEVEQHDKSQKYKVSRSFHDFQFLEQQLFHSGQNLYGYILPPFPANLNSQSKEQTSYPETSNGKYLPGYGRFVSDEYQLFHWLRLVLEHPVFGHSGLIEPFLTEKNIPPPGKIVKPIGIIKSIQDTIDSRKYAHKDCDLFFQNERDWSIKVHELMQLSTDAFNSTINARHSLSQVLAHLSAALSVPVGDNTGLNKIALQTNLAFSKALDGYREYVEAETINGASTLGATLLLWTRFVESEKEMLKHRTCLLVDYESANRNFDRARGQRRPEVEQAKWDAERAFEKCSDIARGEIKRFQTTRVRDLSRSLNEYRNTQLNLAKDHYEKLFELYQQVANELKMVNIPA